MPTVWYEVISVEIRKQYFALGWLTGWLSQITKSNYSFLTIKVLSFHIKWFNCYNYYVKIFQRESIYDQVIITGGAPISPRIFFQKNLAILTHSAIWGQKYIFPFKDEKCVRIRYDVIIWKVFRHIESFTIGSNEEKYQNMYNHFIHQTPSNTNSK